MSDKFRVSSGNQRNAPATNDEAEKKGKGCLFKGCLVLLIVFVAGGLAAFFGVRHYANKYTSDAPTKFEQVDSLSADEMKALDERIKAFSSAMETPTNAVTLSLNERELNALIMKAPELKDTVRAKIDGNKLKGKVSVPLGKIPMMSGRYLNGEAGLTASLKDGQLVVNIQNLTVNGQSPPEKIMTEVRKENVAKDATANNPDLKKTLGKLESLTITNGVVTLKSRASTSSGTDPPAGGAK